MTLHTRIFGLKLGLILWGSILATILVSLMLAEQYLDVVSFFIGMFIGEGLKRSSGE